MKEATEQQKSTLERDVYKRQGQHRVGDVQAPGDVEFLADAPRVVEKDEVGPALGGHIGKVMGAKLA